ncbi:MAG: C4-type zinc ribbon domain-containing protein [Verrucomicrobiota bacterium]
MLEDIKKLLIIQDRDQSISKIEKELTRLPGEEELARQKLAGDNAAVETADMAVKENAVAIKNFEIDVETRRDTIAKLKVQQYETKKNEEFQALTNEIKRYEDEVVKLEDEELELMETAETLKADLGTAREKQAETQKLVDEDLAQIAERKKNIEVELSDLKQDRADLSGDMEETTLDRYTRIFAKKGDAAVVPLNNGICGGCHMKVTTATFTKVKAEKEIAYCEQCGRILYWGD